ncbi:mucin-2 isoform X2 [Armigeres subalbatus]|uniref:mucin-2 isoform X2 n=1 Tax=Armigeres subalbatus TaxID=124917 RepID=UPI002ECFF4BB
MMAESATTNASPTAANPTGGVEPIPQWKKELLQRRKNLAKTIGTAATQVHDSASTVAAALTTTPTTPRAGAPCGSPFACAGGQKDPSVVAAPSIVAETSCPTITTSVPSSAPATSPTPSNTTTPTSSLFGAPVFVGHSPVNEHPATSPQQVLVKSVLVGGSTTNTIASSASTRAAEVPLHAAPQQSHSNDGPESTSCTSSTSRSLSHLHSSNNSNSGASSGGPVGKYAATSGGSGISASSASVDCELTRPTSSGEISNSYSSISEIGWKSKKNTSSASSSSNPKMVAASAEEIIYEKNPRFVGPGGEGTTVDVDSSEELKYGPGIVSKLRCRYLSLALRQSANKQRPSLNNMRRATSLNNLLDEEGEDLSEREQSIEAKDHHQSSQDKNYLQSHNGKFGQIPNQMNSAAPKAKTPDEYISTFQKSVQNSYMRSGRQTEKKNEYNRYNKQRGADSLKRARSVEALVRYDHKAWERDIQKENLYSSNDSNVIIFDEISCTNGTNGNNCQSVAMNKAELITDCVTIEEKIINGREKGDPKPKRLTSFIDADERPPPDVVRQTMKIFEANANRRGRPTARTNGAAGEVAAKVASYKSIISQEKPPITHPKPPLSPKKPNIIPRSTSPKPNGTPAQTVTPAATNGLKEKPTLPKLDIGLIRNNLETTNNLKNSATGLVQSPTANHNNNNTSTPLSVRVPDSQSYRLKYDSPALSPNSTAVSQHKVNSSTTTTTNRPESPRAAAAAACMQNNTSNSTALTFIDSPSIPTLASKLNNLNIATSTPTSTRSSTPQDLPPLPPQAPPRQPQALQYATSDEEDPDDPEDQQHEYSINHSDRENDSDQSYDLEPAEGDDYNEHDDSDSQEVKKVSRAAMDNISRAGVTTQFRFNGQSQQNKSHLPSLSGGAKLLSNKKLNTDDHLYSASNSSSSSSSPITVPAAVPATVIAHKPPVPMSRESLASTNGLKSNNTNSSNIGSVAHNFNSVNSSNANTNISASPTNNSNSIGSKVMINESVAPAPPNVSVSTGSDVSKTVNLTAREIEKNQINLVKSEESLNNSASSAAATPNNSAGSVGVVQGKTGAGSDVSRSGTGGDFFMAKWGAQKPAATAAAQTENVVSSSLLGGLVPAKKKVKAPPPPIEANTMVFNFSDRKDVPDYIENDGIILRPRPRELPKPGESGFVVLGDLTLETSTDPDDSWAMGPPSPCDVEFANANIVINGKSSMRTKTSRDNKFKIQFDDSLTSTFEYPSETSLLEATNNGFEDEVAEGLKDAAAILASSKINIAGNTSTGSSITTPATTTTTTTGSAGGGGGGGGLTFGDNGLLSHKNNLLSSMPLGSAPFASYTPVKAAIDTTFELGVTRTPSPSSTASSTCSSNEHHPHNQQSQQQQQQHHHQPHHQHQQHSNGHHIQHQQLHQQQPSQGRINGTTGSGINGDGNGALLLLNGDAGEPESIQYLKPASDEQTVNWSQGTRVTDLLF